MSIHFNRQSFSWVKFNDARLIVHALAAAARNGNGVYSRDLPGQQPRRPIVMQWLREMGVPVAARKQGRNTLYYIISQFPAAEQQTLADQWWRRVFQHHYAEDCRAYIALQADPHTRAQAQVFQQRAIDLGLALGLPLPDITADLTPTPMGRHTQPEFGGLLNGTP